MMKLNEVLEGIKDAIKTHKKLAIIASIVLVVVLIFTIAIHSYNKEMIQDVKDSSWEYTNSIGDIVYSVDPNAKWSSAFFDSKVYCDLEYGAKIKIVFTYDMDTEESYVSDMIVNGEHADTDQRTAIMATLVLASGEIDIDAFEDWNY